MTATILASRASPPAITVTRVGCADGYGEALVRSTVSGGYNVAVLRDVGGTWDQVAFGPDAATSAPGVPPKALADLSRIVGPAPTTTTTTQPATTSSTAAATTTTSPSDQAARKIAQACSDFNAINEPAQRKATAANSGQNFAGGGVQAYNFFTASQLSPAASLADQAAILDHQYTKVDTDFGALIDVLTPSNGASHADQTNYYNAVVTDCGGCAAARFAHR